MERELIDQGKEELLLDYFNNELDDARRSAVERWLDEKPENRKEYERLVKDCLHIRWARKEMLVDAERGKKMMLWRINRARVRRIWYSVAASIAIMIADGGSVPDE